MNTQTQRLTQQFMTRPKERVKILNRIKHEFSTSKTEAIFDRLYETQCFQESIFSPLPKKYEELSPGDGPRLMYNEDWIIEIEWQSRFLVRHSHKIEQFIALRHAFGSSLLRGDYKTAEELMKQIEADICVSIWSLERSFLLKHLQSGFSGNKQFLQMIHTTATSPTIKLLAGFFSVRVEPNVNHEYYNRLVNTNINQAEGAFPPQVSYLNSHVLPWEQSRKEHIAFILNREYEASIIDRYNTVLRVLRTKATEALSASEIARLQNTLQRMNSAISDPALLKVSSYILSGILEVKGNANQHSYFSALDLYTRGDYGACISATIALIQSSPSHYAPYELLAKAAAHAKQSEVKITSAPSLINDLISHLLKIFRLKEDIRESIPKLQKIAMDLGENHLSYSIRNRVQQEISDSIDNTSLLIAELHSGMPNPTICKALPLEKAQRCARLLHDLFPKSATMILLEAELSGDFDFNTLAHLVDHTRLKISFCRQLAKEKKFDEIVNTLSPLRKTMAAEAQPDHLFLAALAREVLNALLALGRKREALGLTCECYLSNPQTLRSLNFLSLLSRDLSEEDPDWDKNIDLAILRYVVAHDTQDAYEAVDDFLFANGCQKPTDLLQITETFDKRRLHFFLTTVCTLDVMSRGAHYASNTDELEQQRLDLCSFLHSRGGENPHHYRQELNELTKRRAIRSALRQIDEDRLSVDHEMIANLFAQMHSDTFIRYLHFREQERAGFSQVGLSELATATREDPLTVRPLASVSQARERFGELLYSFVGFYLFEEHFGLDATLSVRVRHGNFLTHARAPFESNQLLLKKDGKLGAFIPSEYWRDKLKNEEPAVFYALNDALTEFTSEMNKLIAHFTDNIVQIRLQNKDSVMNYHIAQPFKPEGLFDFRKWLEDLDRIERIYFSDVETLDEFIESVMILFSEMIESCLNDIRNYLKGEFSNVVQQLLRNLSTKIKALPIPNHIQRDFAMKLTDSEGRWQGELARIQTWFRISSGGEIQDINLRHVFNAVITALNDACDNYFKHITVNISCDVQLKGKYFPAFYDLLFILLHNIVEHSQLDGHLAAVVLSVDLNSTTLTVKVENSVRDSELLNQHIATVQSILDTSTNAGESSRIRIEGKSGFIKIKRILRSNLKRKSFLVKPGTINSKFHVSVEMERDDLFV